MLLFPFLSLLDSGLNPTRTKVHLATWNGTEDPLDEFVEGRFDQWQEWQRHKNFSREVVLSLIARREPGQWLFAGLFDVRGCDVRETGPCPYKYRLDRRIGTADLEGRLIVSHARSGRQAYLLAENCASRMTVAGLLLERLTIAEFPGYVRIRLPKRALDAIVRQQVHSWQSALGSVGGVYLITDTSTGKLYVGSATGVGGIWQRWCDYSATGHGGNSDLRALLAEYGLDHAAHFQFAILETADSKTGRDEILQREGHWKEVLATRQHGHNAN